MGYIIVSDEIEKKWKLLDSDEAKEMLLHKAIEGKGKDIEFELATMEERMQVFKLMSLKHKQALQQIRNDEYEMLEPLWEELQKIEPKITARAEELKNKLYPLKDEVTKIVELVKSVDAWEIKRLTELVEIVDGLSEKKLDALKHLISYYKGDA